MWVCSLTFSIAEDYKIFGNGLYYPSNETLRDKTLLHCVVFLVPDYLIVPLRF